MSALCGTRKTEPTNWLTRLFVEKTYWSFEEKTFVKQSMMSRVCTEICLKMSDLKSAGEMGGGVFLTSRFRVNRPAEMGGGYLRLADLRGKSDLVKLTKSKYPQIGWLKYSLPHFGQPIYPQIDQVWFTLKSTSWNTSPPPFRPADLPSNWPSPIYPQIDQPKYPPPPPHFRLADLERREMSRSKDLYTARLKM